MSTTALQLPQQRITDDLVIDLIEAERRQDRSATSAASVQMDTTPAIHSHRTSTISSPSTCSLVFVTEDQLSCLRRQREADMRAERVAFVNRQDPRKPRRRRR